jgi:hypothetical protein
MIYCITTENGKPERYLFCDAKCKKEFDDECPTPWDKVVEYPAEEDGEQPPLCDSCGQPIQAE